jgi:hypothetical protein
MQVFAVFIIADVVTVESKTVKRLLVGIEGRLLNYLEATKYEVGRLVNSGLIPGIKR